MSIRHEAMLVPTTIYKHLKYNTYYKIISDHDFAIKLYKRGYTHYEIPKCLLNFKDNGISNNNFDQITYERRHLLRSNLDGLDNESIRQLSNEQQITFKTLEKVATTNQSHNIINILDTYSKRRNLSEPSSNIFNNLKKNNVKISIIIPVYNGQHTIESTLRSILPQINKEVEVICVNDSSNDQTGEIIEAVIAAHRLEKILTKEWDKNVDNIIVIDNPKQKGVSFARNIGIQSAKGEYVFFVDADDKVAPGAIDILLDSIDNQTDIIVGNIKLLGSEQLKGIVTSEPKTGDIYQLQHLAMSTENFLGAIYKRSIATNILFSDYKMGEDSLFWIQAILMARQIKLINTILYEYNSNNPYSAQHNYSHEKYINELEWRERAANLLKYAGLHEAGKHLITKYWNHRAFKAMHNNVNSRQYREFGIRLDEFIDNMALDEETAENLKDMIYSSCYI